MPFQVQLEHYSGPLQLLIELIREKKLPITEVSLAKVTDDFLSFLNTHEVPSQELADFLVIATRLLLLKSHTLLSEESIEEEDSSSLADQLRLYQEYLEAAKYLEQAFESPRKLFARGKALVYLTEQEVMIPEGCSAESLQNAFGELLKRLAPWFSIEQSRLMRVISVQERLEQVRTLLLDRARLTFGELIRKGGSKVDIVVSFLALLELVKSRAIHATQSELFSDIEIKRID